MKIMLVSDTPPWPLSGGGPQRTFFLVRALRDLGVVDLVVCGQEATLAIPDCEETALFGKIHAAEWQDPMPIRWAGPLNGILNLLRGEYFRNSGNDPLHRKVREIAAAGNYDLIVGRYPGPTAMCGVDRLRDFPLVLDIDDVPWRKVLSELNSGSVTRVGSKALVLLRAFFSFLCYSRLFRAFDHLWVAKESDLTIAGRQRLSVLPNIPMLPPCAACGESHAPDGTPTLLMVGSFWYKPNQQGLQWFLDRVWPVVRSALPAARLRIVGRDSDLLGLRHPRHAEDPQIRFVGLVDDLAAEYRAASATIAPVRSGGGTKIKVLESLAYGLPCVATSHAAEGFNDLDGASHGLFVSDTPEAFSEACLTLLMDPERGARAARHGRSLILTLWNEDAVKTAVHAGVRQAQARFTKRRGTKVPV